MSALIVDANVAIDWFIASEPGEAYSIPLAESAYDGHLRLHVPVNFHVEVCGQLIRHHRSKTQVFHCKVAGTFNPSP